MKSIASTRNALTNRAFWLIAVFLTGLTLSACDEGGEQDTENLFSRAVERREQGNLRASTIDLKTILQKDPKNTKARLLLGDNYIDVGDSASAEKELTVARELGAEEDQVLLPLGEARLMQGKYEAVLETSQVAENDPAKRIYVIHYLRGRALLGLQKYEKAKAEFDASLLYYAKDINEERPHLKLTEPEEYLGAIIELARIAIAKGDWEEAGKLVARGEKIQAQQPDLLAVKGEILYKREKFKESEEAFQKASDAKPTRMTYELGIARAQLANNDTKKAIEHLDHALKYFPDNIQANYYRGLAGYLEGDYQTAKQRSENVLKLNDNHIPSYLISGAASFALGQLEQANKLLTRYLSAVPASDWARKMLGATQLRLNRPSEALATLRPIADQKSEDKDLLQMVGTAALRAGELNAASDFFQQAVNLSPEDTDAQTRLGLTKLAAGDRTAGIETLERAIETAPENLRARYSLMHVHLRLGEFKKALEVASELRERDPDNATPLIGIGLANIGLKKRDEALAAFKEALEKSPKHVGAMFAIAEIHQSNKDIDAARQALKRVLEVKPDHLGALLRLANLEAQAGKQAESYAYVEQAMKAHPKAITPRILVAQSYLRKDEPLKALTTIKEVLDANPDSPGLLLIAGQAQIDLGKSGESARTLEHLVRTVPKFAQGHYLLARAYSMLGNRGRMHEELERAIALNPKFLPASLASVRGLIIDGKEKEALARFAKLKSDYPESDHVRALEGWIATRRNDAANAAQIYQDVFEERPNSRVAIDLATARWKSNDGAGAVKVLTEWTAKHPRDLRAKSELANYYILLGLKGNAAPILEDIVQQDPKNWVALNNLADVLLESEPKRAVEFARNAYKLAPKAPPVIVTLTDALLKNDLENGRALTLIRGVVRNYPDNIDARFVLAKALVKSGAVADARKVLTDLLATDLPKDMRSEAETLLKNL